MSKRSFIKSLFCIALIVLSACNEAKQQNLPFEVTHDSIAFTLTNSNQTYPQLIVITRSQDTDSVDFSNEIGAYLEDTEFDKVFVILLLRGQTENSGTIQSVTIADEEIIVHAKAIDPGPGNYVVEGFSPPYQIIRVEKSNITQATYSVTLERVEQGIVSTESVNFP